MQCPVKTLKHYFAANGTMKRKPFIRLVLFGYVGLSLLTIALYIVSLTSEEYAALKAYQDTVGSGALPHGYGFADYVRFILSLVIIPGVIMRLRDCGKHAFWALMLLPSIALSGWWLVAGTVPVQDDVRALMHVIFYLTLFILMLKKTKPKA